MVPLKSVTAKAVAEAVIGIFGRIGLPLQIISDNGAQFTGKLMIDLTGLFGVDRVKTMPYHPQANGVIEGMHANLEGMLRKAYAQGKDSVAQILFAHFALRQMPNRDTGFSPYELLYGRNVHTPLDVVYAGWREKALDGLDTDAWVCDLADRLEVMRDVATDIGLKERKKEAKL